MNSTPKWLGLLAIAFVSGTFVASPELRAFAANTVFSADIVDGEVKTADMANNAVTAAKVKDGEIKAAEIATDAVGAAELQGVTKFLFGQCALTDSQETSPVNPGSLLTVSCNINGVDGDDNAFAMLNDGGPCFSAAQAGPTTGTVFVELMNNCSTAQSVGKAANIAVLVYDK